jgi:integrase
VPITLKGEAYNNFIDSLRASRTKSEYSRALSDFAAWRNVKTLDQLLIGDPLEIKKHITKYLTHLKNERKLSSSSRGIACASLRHFYAQNDKILNWDIITKFVGEDDTKHQDREYNYEEIAKLLAAADIKYKAILLLMSSSAIRIGALPSMRVGDLVKMKGHDIYKVVIYARTKYQYYSFCTPEAYKAIREYLDLRSRFGEILKDSSPLWRNDFDGTNLKQVKNPKPLGYNAIRSKLRYLLIKTGITERQKLTEGRRRNEVMMAHGFRKFAYTQMGLSHVNAEVRELVCGHKIGVRGTYLKYTPEDMLAEYERAVDKLTIDPAKRLQAKVDDYKKQELEIQDLRREKDEQIKRLQDELESLKENLPSEKELKELWEGWGEEFEKRINKARSERLAREAEEKDKLNLAVKWPTDKKSRKS